MHAPAIRPGSWYHVMITPYFPLPNYELDVIVEVEYGFSHCKCKYGCRFDLNDLLNSTSELKIKNHVQPKSLRGIFPDI